MKETGQPEDTSFYTSIQDFLSAPADFSPSSTNYIGKKEPAIENPPVSAVPKICSGSAGSHPLPLVVSGHRERSPPARRDLSPPAGLALPRSIPCSNSASTVSPASFEKWSVPTWAAISPKQHVRAASPMADRSGLQVHRSPRSVSPGPGLDRVPVAPGYPVLSASTQHQSRLPAFVPVMSARDLDGSYSAGRAASLRAASPLPDSATARHRSPAPSPILSAQDLSGLYPGGPVTSPARDSATKQHQSSLPVSVTSAQDLGVSSSPRRAASPAPALAWYQPEFRSSMGGSPRISATSGQSPRQQVQKLCSAQIERPFPLHEHQNQESLYLPRAQKDLDDAKQLGTAKGAFVTNEVHDMDESQANVMPRKDGKLAGFAYARHEMQPHPDMNENSSCPYSPTQCDGTGVTPMSASAQNVQPKTSTDEEDVEAPRPVVTAEEVEVGVGKKLSPTTPAGASCKPSPNNDTCPLEDQPIPSEAKGRSMAKLQTSPAKLNLQKRSVEQINKEKVLSLDRPKEPKLQGKLRGMEQENIRVREQHLRDKLQEVEKENAALRRGCDAAKQELLQANKSLQDAEQQCQVFQKRWTEVQGQFDIVVSERDVLKEQKDHAENMLRAALEHWEADQRRLVEVEKRLEGRTKQLPEQDIVALGDKLAALKATSMCNG
eukprot:gnl/MRDRNA2_/MRDRNA2_27022_c0_seq2.p1 gnl/MRDRNA2_/MRDRNA2_27022_c0~~gnl/MRDRNA2_/MRDRNA2_27022_c0_seq2.p1  ORF type:complete len:663 (+),score=134.11 gnl/MRDRNA2_/MRDRNA2_27022_c0_seq2:103-2091(+)